MSRYKLADHPDGDFAVLDKDTGRIVKTLPSFDEAMRLLARLNTEILTEPAHRPLSELIREAVAAFDAMPPEEQKAHLKAQRESWVRGEMALRKWEKENRASIIEMQIAASRCDCREKLARAERALDHYRVALAQISRTTSDAETAEYAIDTLTEAAAMLKGE